jgi:hypothetical protein
MAKRKQQVRNEETVSGYFRRIFRENPKLLRSGSNKETVERWLQDHPADKEMPQRAKYILSNVKSVLRKKGRRKKRMHDEQEREAGRPVQASRPSRHGLEHLEEQIDELMTVARLLDRDGLANIIQLLRRARNEVVWKIGQ